jgi:hypothetical protein
MGDNQTDRRSGGMVGVMFIGLFVASLWMASLGVRSFCRGAGVSIPAVRVALPRGTWRSDDDDWIVPANVATVSANAASISANSVIISAPPPTAP